MNAPQKISLYSLSLDFAALEELIDAQQGALTEGEADVVAQWFATLNGQLEDKLRGCIAWAREHEALADAAAGEAKRLLDLAKVRRARVERLKSMIHELFVAQEIKKVDTTLGPVRRVKNGGKAPLVGIEDLDLSTVPEDCKRTITEPVKDAIRARIEAGERIGDVKIGERSERIELG